MVNYTNYPNSQELVFQVKKHNWFYITSLTHPLKQQSFGLEAWAWAVHIAQGHLPCIEIQVFIRTKGGSQEYVSDKKLKKNAKVAVRKWII